MRVRHVPRELLLAHGRDVGVAHKVILHLAGEIAPELRSQPELLDAPAGDTVARGAPARPEAASSEARGEVDEDAPNGGLLRSIPKVGQAIVVLRPRGAGCARTHATMDVAPTC